MFSYNRLFNLFISAFLSTFIVACSDVEQRNSPVVDIAQASMAELEQVSGYQVPRAYIGKITTNQFAPLSFEYNGSVSALFVDNGDTVKKGDILATLNTQLLAIKLAELKAQLAKVQAQIKLNNNNLGRIQALEKKSYASAQNIDELTTEQAVLSANQQQLIANIDSLLYQIDRSKLKAPFDGTISNRSIAQGANVQSGQVIFQLIKQNDSEVKVGVSSQLASTLTVGQTVTVEIARKQYQGKIIRIGQQINPINRTVNLRVAIDNNVQAYNDQLAKVLINQTIEHKGYWVPIDALTDGVRGQWNILLSEPMETHYRLKLAVVKVNYATKTHAFISGLDSKEALYVDQGVHKFVPQQLVKMHTELLAENL